MENLGEMLETVHLKGQKIKVLWSQKINVCAPEDLLSVSFENWVNLHNPRQKEDVLTAV